MRPDDCRSQGKACLIFHNFKKQQRLPQMLQTHLGQLFFYAKIRLFQKYLPLFFRPPPGLREHADAVVYWWTLKKST